MIRFQADLCIIINYDSCRIVANHEFPTEAPSCKSQEPTVEVPALKPSEPREQRPVLPQKQHLFQRLVPPQSIPVQQPPAAAVAADTSTQLESQDTAVVTPKDDEKSSDPVRKSPSDPSHKKLPIPILKAKPVEATPTQSTGTVKPKGDDQSSDPGRKSPSDPLHKKPPVHEASNPEPEVSKPHDKDKPGRYLVAMVSSSGSVRISACLNLSQSCTVYSDRARCVGYLSITLALRFV